MSSAPGTPGPSQPSGFSFEAGRRSPPGSGPDPGRSADAALPAVLARFGESRASRYPVGVRVLLPPLPAHAGPPAVAAAPRPSRRRRRAGQITAVALAVLIAIIGVVVVRNAYGPAPREVVQELFDKLAARDTDALYLAGRCSTNPLCATSALKAGYQPPTNVHIDGERTPTSDPKAPGSKQRTVTVSYDLNGRRITNQVGLSYRKPGFIGGYWSITTPPGGTITVPGPTRVLITLAGITLPPIAADGAAEVWAPPGVYTISKNDTVLFEPGQVTVTVDSEKPTTVSLPDTIKPPVTEQILRQIRDGVDACAAQHVFTPDIDLTPGSINTCPMRHSSRYVITDEPRWTVLRYPELRLEPGPNGTITVTTATAGRAAIHYRWTLRVIEPRQWSDVDAVEDFTVNGRVTAEHGTPTWTPG